jgi:thymidine phosphorylase
MLALLKKTLQQVRRMHKIKSILVVSVISLLVACGSSPQQKKDLAEAKYTDEKTKTLKEYKECLKKAKGDEQKMDICERLLKAVESTAN